MQINEIAQYPNAIITLPITIQIIGVSRHQFDLKKLAIVRKVSKVTTISCIPLLRTPGVLQERSQCLYARPRAPVSRQPIRTPVTVTYEPACNGSDNNQANWINFTAARLLLIYHPIGSRLSNN